MCVCVCYCMQISISTSTSTSPMREMREMRRCARRNETRTRDGARGRSGRAPALWGFARRLACACAYGGGSRRRQRRRLGCRFERREPLRRPHPRGCCAKPYRSGSGQRGAAEQRVRASEPAVRPSGAQSNPCYDVRPCVLGSPALRCACVCVGGGSPLRPRPHAQRWDGR
jgi:hypothetical protein